MLKVLTIGDPHFGRQPSFLKPGFWRKCVTEMLRAALAEAIKAKVHVLVILGDTFDNNSPNPKEHAEFIDFVFLAHEAGIKIIVLRGNHDYEDSESNALEPYEKMRGMVTIINKTTTMKIKGVTCRFYPWSPPDVHPDLGKIKAKVPMLIFHHTEAHGSKMDNGWLSDGFHPDARHFYIGGHLHTWQLVGKRAIYPGIALSGHWNHEPKGFMLLTAKADGSKLRVTHKQLSHTPPFRMVELPLADYIKLPATDSSPTYYRVILKTGETVPDDKRIVSHNRIRDDSLVPKKNKTKDTYKSLPNPLVWLVTQLPKEHQTRGHQILSSVAKNLEEAA